MKFLHLNYDTNLPPLTMGRKCLRLPFFFTMFRYNLSTLQLTTNDINNILYIMLCFLDKSGFYSPIQMWDHCILLSNTVDIHLFDAGLVFVGAEFTLSLDSLHITKYSWHQINYLLQNTVFYGMSLGEYILYHYSQISDYIIIYIDLFKRCQCVFMLYVTEDLTSNL